MPAGRKLFPRARAMRNRIVPKGVAKPRKWWALRYPPRLFVAIPVPARVRFRNRSESSSKNFFHAAYPLSLPASD